MKCNIGSTDKALRYIAAFVIFALGLYFKSWWGLIGLIPLGVAISGWCPPYALLGIDTSKPAVETVMEQQSSPPEQPAPAEPQQESGPVDQGEEEQQ